VFYIKVPDTYHRNGHYVLGFSIINLLNDSEINLFYIKK